MVAWKRNVFLGEMEACREEFKKTRFLKYLIFGTDGIGDIWGDGKYRYKANVKSYTEKNVKPFQSYLEHSAFCILL